MCEFIAQPDSIQSCLERLGYPPMPFAPATQQLSDSETLHSTGNALPNVHDRDRVIKPNHLLTAVTNVGGELRSLQVRWGWSPIWSMGTRPPLTHLPLEIVMRSKVFRRMDNRGRALVAVDGWFDADVENVATGRTRFNYVRTRSNEPVFLAAVAQISASPSGCDGLVLVTQGGGGATGPLQLLAFTGESAVQWLDPDLDWERARALPALDIYDGQYFEQVAVSHRGLQKIR